MHVAFEKVSIKRIDKWIIEKKIFLYETGDNSDRTMNTQSNSCRRATGSIPNEPSS